MGFWSLGLGQQERRERPLRVINVYGGGAKVIALPGSGLVVRRRLRPPVTEDPLERLVRLRREEQERRRREREEFERFWNGGDVA